MLSGLAVTALLAALAPVRGQNNGGQINSGQNTGAPDVPAPRGGRQGIGGGRGGRGTTTAKAAAPIDVTGYWVSIVTAAPVSDDSRSRSAAPPKGNYQAVPLNPAGRAAANAWDPAKDEAAGQQCKSYGAAAIMRVPGRFRFTWADDNTLRVEADAGTQTRTFHFGGTVRANLAPSWQGYSIAQWEMGSVEPGKPRAGNLKVVTTALLPGYLRKNGVPYSGNAQVTEWYDRITAPNGDDWLVVSTEVVDPQYLTMPFITSTRYKKQADATGFNPEACTAR